jgi:hypothetical protein
MRRAVGILSILTVSVFAATLAMAADPYGSEGSGTTSGVTGAMAGFMGQHTLTGKITDIDKESGKVSVSAEGHDLDLHFPTSAIQNLNKGDQVTVSLGIKPAGSGTAGTRGVPPRMPGAGMPGSGTPGMPDTPSGGRY